MRISKSFLPALAKAIAEAKECDWIDVYLTDDHDDPRYEVAIVTGVYNNGDIYDNLIKEARDKRSQKKPSL